VDSVLVVQPDRGTIGGQCDAHLPLLGRLRSGSCWVVAD
jgi:hypothetical protein